MRDNQNELLPVVTPQGEVVGCATRGECHGEKRPLHPVVHLHVFNGEGKLYLQLRPRWKDIQPGKWDTAVGGHVDYGEETTDALRREVREELGITDFTPDFSPDTCLNVHASANSSMYLPPCMTEKYARVPRQPAANSLRPRK